MSSFADQLEKRYTETCPPIHELINPVPIYEVEARRQLLQDVAKRAEIIDEHGGSEKARVHIGVAGTFNFDVLATGKHDAAVLVDMNNNQKTFWGGMIRLLKDSPTKEDMMAHIDENAAAYFDLKDFPTHETDITGPGYKLAKMQMHNLIGDTRWVHDPASYQRIRTMALEGKLIPLSLDVFDTKACEDLASAIEACTIDGKPALIDTVYGSNIWDMSYGDIFLGSDLYEMQLPNLLDRISHDVMGMDKIERQEPIAKAIREYAHDNRVEGTPPLTDDTVQLLAEIIVDEQISAENQQLHRTALSWNIAERLKQEFTLSDFQTVGFLDDRREHYYEQDIEPHLNGFQALAGNNHSAAIYLCSTIDSPDSLLKLSPHATGREGGSSLPSH